MFTLRRAVAADAAAVRTLVRDAYAKWVPLIGREPKPMTANYDTAVRLNRVDLAHVEGELAGLIETIDRSDHLLIENVAVAPQRHGQGVGRALMSHAETVARAAGYREVRLYTNQRFEANVQLYLRLGYSIDREEDGPLGVTVYMSKSLRPA
ncbi:MAG: GNAT family N-acetyltransferase [Reyranella sp.]